MKKLLLLLCTLFVSVSAWAETDSYDAAVTSSPIRDAVSGTVVTGSNTYIKDSYKINYSGYIRSGAGSKITISALDGASISEIRINLSSTKVGGILFNGYQQGGTVTANVGTVTLEEPNYVDTWNDYIKWSGSSSEPIIISHNKAINWTSIDVIYTIVSTSANITVSAAGYSTFFSNKAVELPTGVEGWVAYMDGSFNFEKAYSAGDVVPANTGIVLKAEAGDYALDYTSSGVAPTNNDLCGSVVATTTVGPDSEDYLFYALSTGSQGVGFYWLADDGAAFTSAAHKAYLPVKKSDAARAGYGFDEATAISAIEAEKAATTTFNLAGQRVENAKGLVIKNGKKVFVK